MKDLLKYFLLIMLMVPAFGMAQEEKDQALPDSLKSDEVLLEKLWTIGLQINTNGWGVRMRRGKNLALLKQFMWEIEFSTYKSAKEIRTINPFYSDAKSYFYGKLNYLYFFKGGIGVNRILNRKPYWGGVQLSYLYFFGPTICLAKPVYLNIISVDQNSYMVREEKYDPEKHFPDNIYGRASFLRGFNELKVYPGVYFRGALDFEFGTKNRRINALESGFVLEYSPFPIPVMAYNPRQSFFLTLYVSYSFGKRFNYRGE